jgi:hypothetical protein
MTDSLAREKSFKEQFPDLYAMLRALAEQYGIDGLRSALDEIEEDLP